MTNSNASLFFILNLMLMMTTLADTPNDDSLDAEFLDFLAEVDEATGDGFDLWLDFDTEADKDEEEKQSDTNNDTNL